MSQAVFTAPHMPLPVDVAGGRVAGRKRKSGPEAGGEKAGDVPSTEYRCLDSLLSVPLPCAPLSAVLLDQSGQSLSKRGSRYTDTTRGSKSRPREQTAGC